MRILTTAAQVRRVSGIDGPGDFPDYPYSDPIPREVGQALLDGLSEVAWPADRDFLNNDGGHVVVLEAAADFEERLRSPKPAPSSTTCCASTPWTIPRPGPSWRRSTDLGSGPGHLDPVLRARSAGAPAGEGAPRN